MAWPPPLDDLKLDMGIVPEVERDDAQLQQVLDAAVSFVQRVRPEFLYDPQEQVGSELPEPTPDLVLGVLRLAGRWDTRRRSPDGLVATVDMGSARVTTYDPDIDRLLGIGRFIPPRFA